ncbi:MAG TPA: c-type cytochrome, partial [Thermomicrobiales bacterium]|nr:c-type cytochrome [Thermomicrobiales bacterium]
NPRPVNFTLPHTAQHTDGYLFDIITHGSPGSAMAAWSPKLTDQQRWDLVNYLRSLNALTVGTLPGVQSGQFKPGVGAPAGTPAASGAATPAASVPPVSPSAAAGPRAGTPPPPTAPPAPPTPTAGPTWVEVGHWSDSKLFVTPDFTVTGPWRIRWTLADASQPFLVMIEQDNVTPVLLTGPDGATSGVIERQQGGTYNLMIHNTTPYDVVVEDYRAPATPAPEGATASGGRLIYAADGKVYARPVGGGQPVNLTPNLPNGKYAADPALSPDGTQLVYTLVGEPPPGLAPSARTLPATDLYIMPAGGGPARLLFQHAEPGAVIATPAWTPDGQALVYAYSAPIFDATGKITGGKQELQRLDVATGRRTTLVANGIDPSFAPPGALARLAYARYDPATGQSALWVADPDGANARQIAGAAQGFINVNVPRFSPDGRTIVFAGVTGQTAAPEPVAAPARSPFARLWRWVAGLVVPPPAAAHGLPGDLWTIAPDGSGLRRLTNVAADQPNPTWAPDGTQIAFLSGGGLFLVDPASGKVTKLDDTSSYSTIVWAAR